MEDAIDLGSIEETHESSNLSPGTFKKPLNSGFLNAYY